MTSERHHRYRRTILDALAALDDPASPAALHTQLHLAGLRIGLSTVYRELRSLRERGEVDEITLLGQRYYRRAGTRRTNVFVCDGCGHHETVPADRRWAALADGRLDATKPLIMHGQCTSCRRLERP